MRLRIELVDRIQELPGVEGVSLGTPPLSQGGAVYPVIAEGRGESINSILDATTADYFRVLGISLVEGRLFTSPEPEEKAAVINRVAARVLWPDQSPLGRKIAFKGYGDDHWVRVIGVVDNVRRGSLAEDPVPQVYLPLEQSRIFLPGTVLIRTAGDPWSVFPALRGAVSAVHPALALVDVKSLEQGLSRELSPWRFRLFLVGTFSALAFALAVVGLYSVISYTVLLRRREVGVRLALGAQVAQVAGLVIRDGCRLAWLGILIGVGGAILLNQTVSSMIFGFSTTDPATYSAIVVTWILTAALASYLPARRAGKVDPITVLRQE